MNVLKSVSRIWIVTLIAVAWFSSPGGVARAQTPPDEMSEEAGEHSGQAARWLVDFTNPTKDPNALERRLQGFAQLHGMPNPAAMKVTSGAAWIQAGTSQTDNSTQTGTISGRGTCLSVHMGPSDTTFYYGVTQGGLWKSTNAGVDWTSCSDKWATLAVGGVAVDPKNPDIVYAGTGEMGAALNDAGNSYAVTGPTTGGTGILKSTDGGLNWHVAWPRTGLVSNQMLVNPANSNFVYLACMLGVVMSSDSGHTWQNTCKISSSTSIVIDPVDPSVVYAAGGSSIWKSRDTGKTWRKLSGYGTAGTMLLAMSKSDHLRLYVSIDYGSGPRVDMSTDSGATWHKVLGITRYGKLDYLGQFGNYAHAIAVDPNDASHVVVGGLDTYIYNYDQALDTLVFTGDSSRYNTQSTDLKYVHPDVHVLMYVGSELYAISDGGIHHSKDGGQFWSHEMNNKLSTLQFVGGDMLPDASGNPIFFVAGAQDNGLNILGKTQRCWKRTCGGDGGRMFIAQDATSQLGAVVYGTNYGANLHMSGDGGSTWIGDGSGQPANILQGSGLYNRIFQGGGWKQIGEDAPFYMQYDVSASNPQEILLCGYSHVYMVNDAFSNTPDDIIPIACYNKADPNLIDGQPECAMFGPQGEIFVGTRAKGVYYSVNSGTSFAKGNFKLGIPSGFATDPSDNFVYMTTKSISNNFGGNFYVSSNGGQDWTAPADTTLPKNLNYYAVAATKNMIFVGHDYGVLYSTDGGRGWINTAPFGLPQVIVTSMKVRGHYLIVTTYGRGMYYIDVNTLPAEGVSTSRATTPAAASIGGVYPNPILAGVARSTVHFSLADDSRTTLAVYDVLGREERVLMNEWSAKGEYDRSVDLSNLPAGQHYIMLTAGGTSVTKPITIE